MLKRVAVALLIALLLASAAVPAAAQTYVCENLCTFDYPDDWEDFGADSSNDEEGEYYNLAFIGGSAYDDLNVSVDLYYYDVYADIRLFSADEATLRDYVRDIESSFYEVASSEVVEVGEYGIPFAILRGTDRDGEALYAETLANGWCIAFYGYAYGRNGREMRELTDEDERIFREIIASFEPILKERGT